MLACALAACIATACDRPAASVEVSAAGAPLTIGLTSTSVNVRPLVNIFTHFTLVGTSPDGRPSPSLLERWTMSPDGRTWEFVLRPGVVAHDGTPVTAADVPALIAVDPEAIPPAGLLDVTRVEVVDERRLRVHLNAPSSLLLEAFTLSWGVPAGPFFPSTPEVPPDSSPTLIGRTKPDGTPPPVTRVIFRRYDSPRSAWAALMRDEIDLLHQVSGDARRFLEGEPGIEVRPFPRPFVITLGLNVRHPALRKTAVRRALNVAIDREAVLARDLDGHGQVAIGPVSLRHWAADPDVEPYPHDPALARRLLDEAGLPMRPGDRGPTRVTLRCLVLAGDPRLERVALRLRRSLSAVGIDLRLEALSHEELATRMQQGHFETYLSPVMSGHGPTAIYEMWGDYAGRWVNHGYSAAEPALERLRRATTDEAFAAAMREVQRVFIEDPPAVFIAWDETARAVGRRFRIPVAPGRDILSSLSEWRPRSAGDSP